MVARRSEKIGRIVHSDVVLDNQEYDKVDQSAVRITARGLKIKKTLKDLKANGEEEGARSEQEEEDAERERVQKALLEIKPAYLRRMQ